MTENVYVLNKKNIESIVNKDYNSGKNISEKNRLKVLKEFAKPLPHSNFLDYVSPKRIILYANYVKNEVRHFFDKYMKKN